MKLKFIIPVLFFCVIFLSSLFAQTPTTHNILWVDTLYVDSSGTFIPLNKYITWVVSTYTGAIDSSNIVANAVRSFHIKSGTITGSDIADDAIDGNHITRAAVGTEEIDNYSVTYEDLGLSSVRGIHIHNSVSDSLVGNGLSSSSSSGKLTVSPSPAGGLVVSSSGVGIGNDSITSNMLDSNCVIVDKHIYYYPSAEVESKGIEKPAIVWSSTASTVMWGGISDSSIINYSIGPASIDTSAITSIHILDSTITSADIETGGINGWSLSSDIVGTGLKISNISGVKKVALNTPLSRSFLSSIPIIQYLYPPDYGATSIPTANNSFTVSDTMGMEGSIRYGPYRQIVTTSTEPEDYQEYHIATMWRPITSSYEWPSIEEDYAITLEAWTDDPEFSRINIYVKRVTGISIYSKVCVFGSANTWTTFGISGDDLGTILESSFPIVVEIKVYVSADDASKPTTVKLGYLKFYHKIR